MNSKEVCQAIFQIEEDLDLFEQEIGGVYFWERVRFAVYMKILMDSGIIGEPHTQFKKTFLNRAKTVLNALKNTVIKNPYFATSKDILFFGSPRRKLQQDGKWWDLYCDPIIEDLNHSYLYVEPPYLNHHSAPARTDNIYHADIIYFLAGIQRKARLIKISLTESEKDLVRYISNQISTQFGVEIDLTTLVQQDLLARKSLLPLFRRLLGSVKPKLAMVVCSYGKETFIEACKETKVPVVELQHGVVSKYDVPYSYSGPRRIKRSFPDYFFSFGDFWKECAEFPISKEQIYSVGYPYLERGIEQYGKTIKKDQCLFISEGIIGRALSQFAVKLSNSNLLKYKIIYKLHPGEYHCWEGKYPWLVESGITVVAGDEIPLYQLFAESKIQIGVASMALYEGLAFGLKTYLLALPGVEHMEYLIEKKYATIVTSVNELVMDLEAPSIVNINIEKLFKNNSLQNICTATDQIISLQDIL